MPSVAVTQIMLVSIFALYQNRLSSALLLALGKPNSVAVSASIRMVLIMILLMQGLAQSITTAAVAWVIGEFVAVGYLLFKIIKLTGWPALMTLGLSPSWVRENVPAIRKSS
jgi:O-antigen/teichoic acid export membrane protein